jgi:hypothetical protein
MVADLHEKRDRLATLDATVVLRETELADLAAGGATVPLSECQDAGLPTGPDVVVPARAPTCSNTAEPMGGVKQSGLGREGAAHGLAEFQDVRYVAWHD